MDFNTQIPKLDNKEALLFPGASALCSYECLDTHKDIPWHTHKKSRRVRASRAKCQNYRRVGVVHSAVTQQPGFSWLQFGNCTSTKQLSLRKEEKESLALQDWTNTAIQACKSQQGHPRTISKGHGSFGQPYWIQHQQWAHSVRSGRA